MKKSRDVISNAITEGPQMSTFELLLLTKGDNRTTRSSVSGTMSDTGHSPNSDLRAISKPAGSSVVTPVIDS